MGEDFLAENGGGIELGKFANKFPGTKKKQLELHFDVHGSGRSVRIELPRGHPGRSEPSSGGSPGRREPPARISGIGSVVPDEVPADEPAIPPGRGSLCTGIIREYTAEKGYGFIRVDG